MTMFYGEDINEDCQRVVLEGLGGVGKTQIALEFTFYIQRLSPERCVF
jgi:hypothetical protein